MSTTQTMIEEYDTVALRDDFEGWPAGTLGIVQLVHDGAYRTVEILKYDDGREILDHILVVRNDRLRLIEPALPTS